MKKDEVTAEIIVKENKVEILRVGNVNYISLTDLAKYQNSSAPSFTVKNWLRRIITIDYIGLWKEIHNPDFNLVEFDQIKTEYGETLLQCLHLNESKKQESQIIERSINELLCFLLCQKFFLLSNCQYFK